jgi:hypothetical protein
VLAEAAIDALSRAAREDTIYAATGGGMGPSTIAALEARLLALNPSDALLCYNGRHISLAPRSPVVGLIASIHPCILRSIRIDKLSELDDGPAAPHIRA